MLGYGTSIFCFIPRLWGSRVWINMDGVEWARAKWGKLAKLWFKMMEFAAMWTPDRLIADAESIHSHLQSRHWHMPPVSVVPYGAPVIDSAPTTGLLDKWGLTAGKYHLVVCRLEPENSVKMVINGYLQSGSDNPLVVVGTIDPATDYIKGLLKLNDGRIRFVGPLYDKLKLQTLRYHSMVYFHGHTVGGTNPSLLEAMGCGSIVVAHDNKFNREVAGKIATYFRHEEDVAASIREIESLPLSMMGWMRVMARERIRAAYAWDTIIDTYDRTLTEQITDFYVVRSETRVKVNGLAVVNGREKSRLVSHV
jgi:glycosyltransferase involved in cell wall biosynthesis